jgi:hypothetical protein
MVQSSSAESANRGEQDANVLSGPASLYTDAFGPNVQNILVPATRVIRGKIPANVRKQLSAAVKAGALGHLKKDGLKPEIFFHPNHLHGAVERQKREAEYAIGCIAQVIAVKSAEQRVEEALAALATDENSLSEDRS